SLALHSHSLSLYFFFSSLLRPPLTPTLFPYTTLFRSFYARQVQVALESVDPGKVEAAERTDSCFDGDDYFFDWFDCNGWCCRCRSEEHTSELQSRFDLVCRLLLEKKKQ